MDQKKTTKVHLNYIDGLRALAALYVVSYHSTLYFPRAESGEHVPVLINVLSKIFGYGHYAVTLFIVLSGFCLMMPVSRHGSLGVRPLDFFKKRVRRILPPYYICVAISCLLIATVIGEKTGTGWDAVIPVTWKDVFYHLVMIQDIDYSTASKINHSLWSISVEWRIYFLFPTLLYFWGKNGAKLVVPSLIFFSYLLQYFIGFTPLNSSHYGVCAHYLGLFSLGMLASEISFSDKNKIVLPSKLTWRMISFFSFLITTALLIKTDLPFYVGDFFVALWASSLLVALSVERKGLSFQLLSSRPVAFVGAFAYSIYLMHSPLIQLTTQYLVTPLGLGILSSSLLIWGGSVLVSVIASYVFFLCFEKPFFTKKTPAKVVS